MSDYGRFDRYGLPASFDNWLTTPPDYYDEEEQRNYWEVVYDEENNRAWVASVTLGVQEYERENYPSTYETEEEAQRELEQAVNDGWEVLE